MYWLTDKEVVEKKGCNFDFLTHIKGFSSFKCLIIFTLGYSNCMSGVEYPMTKGKAFCHVSSFTGTRSQDGITVHIFGKRIVLASRSYLEPVLDVNF